MVFTGFDYGANLSIFSARTARFKSLCIFWTIIAYITIIIIIGCYNLIMSDTCLVNHFFCVQIAMFPYHGDRADELTVEVMSCYKCKRDTSTSHARRAYLHNLAHEARLLHPSISTT